MLVIILESISSITSPEEFLVVDGDTNEEFDICKHGKKIVKKNQNICQAKEHTELENDFIKIEKYNDSNNHNKFTAGPSYLINNYHQQKY